MFLLHVVENENLESEFLSSLDGVRQFQSYKEGTEYTKLKIYIEFSGDERVNLLGVRSNSQSRLVIDGKG